MNQSQAAHQLGGEVALLRAECGASGEGDAFTPVDRVAVAVGGHEGRIPRRLYVLRDPVQHEIPGNALPAGSAGSAVLGRGDAPRRDRELHGGRAPGAHAARVDGPNWATVG